MNWIVLDSQITKNPFLLTKNQSQHIQKVLKKTKEGETLRALIPGKSSGFLTIISWEKDQCKVIYQEVNQYQPTFPKIYLLSPLPRPQTGKKFFHLAGAYGVSGICFYILKNLKNQKRNNYEYTTSPIYKENGYEEFWKSGLEQTGRLEPFQFKVIHTKLEEVLFKFFSNFPETLNKPSNSICKIVMDPDNNGYNLREYIKNKKNNTNLLYIILVMGSESGWENGEKEFFIEKWDFHNCFLEGPILRSEYALHAGLYELEVLRSK